MVTEEQTEYWRKYKREYYQKHQERYKELDKKRYKKVKARNEAWKRLSDKEQLRDMWSLAKKILKQTGGKK